jgi:hypothetical protein
MKLLSANRTTTSKTTGQTKLHLHLLISTWNHTTANFKAQLPIHQTVHNILPIGSIKIQSFCLKQTGKLNEAKMIMLDKTITRLQFISVKMAVTNKQLMQMK